jgi:DNA topoisomerase-2
MATTSKYQVLTQVEHVIKRPGMYVGSTNIQPQDHFVDIDGTLQKKSLMISPALYKLFDECVVNAYDQSVLDPDLKNIKVTVDSKRVTLMNDGKGIPIQKFDDTVYIPEVIFSRLLSGSNFDDSTEKFVGGQNGLGVKLCNIFSTEFCIDVSDGEHIYTQTFRNNMSTIEPPKIRKKKGKAHVSVSFTPDFSHFGTTCIDEQHIELFRRRTYDLAALTRSNVHVHFNGEKLAAIKEFVKYVSMFKKEPLVVYKDKGWEFSVCLSDSGFAHTSFVNGINTYIGGTHVDYVVYQICNEVIKTFDEKNKKRAGLLKPFAIKDRLFVLLKCELPNPTFSSQTKEQCTLPLRGLSTLPVLEPKHVMKIYKAVADELLETLEAKEKKQLAKTDGKKTERIFIPMLEDARFAGTAKGEKCTLIVTEGLSSKSFAISGLSSVDRDYFGVFPLKGKPLNVSDSSVTQINNNKEFTALKQILGLKQDKKYTSLKELRYGKLMILSDQDLDGAHIRGLLLNWVHCFWPELLDMGFTSMMFTPIIKAVRGTAEKLYFSMQDYEKDEKEGKLRGFTAHYKKGLGTSTSKEAKDYFAKMSQMTVQFKTDETTKEAVSKAFKKDRADDRKAWILSNTGRKNFTTNNSSITRFIDEELVQFSIYDNERSIPHVLDGLKPSQRKILYTVLEKCGNEPIKVAQLAPRVAELTHYLHGEQSLLGACIGMAQDYLGSNQLNLLLPLGQFGTRLNAKDAASPRYIFTKKNELTSVLFPKEDMPLLKYETMEGVQIEPTYFCPILPMILINGTVGIGTGFSTFVPSYNIQEIVDNVQRCILGKEQQEMHPFYKGFEGTVVNEGGGKYRLLGKWDFLGKTLVVKELPVGVWTDQFKETLDSLQWPYVNKSTEAKVHFEIEMPEGMPVDKVIEELPLKKSVNINNMYLFDSAGKIKKYTDPREIIQEFTKARLGLYEQRRQATINTLSNDLAKLQSKIRFIEMVISEKILIFKKTRAQIIEQLERLQFLTFKDGYSLYLDLKVDDFTTEKISDLQKLIDKNLAAKNALEATTNSKMWLSEMLSLKF